MVTLVPSGEYAQLAPAIFVLILLCFTFSFPLGWKKALSRNQYTYVGYHRRSKTGGTRSRIFGSDEFCSRLVELLGTDAIFA